MITRDQMHINTRQESLRVRKVTMREGDSSRLCDLTIAFLLHDLYAQQLEHWHNYCDNSLLTFAHHEHKEAQHYTLLRGHSQSSQDLHCPRGIGLGVQRRIPSLLQITPWN